MNLHYPQTEIIKNLTFQPDASFSALNSYNIPSDQFNYHLQKLVKLGLIVKQGDRYALTTAGKNYSSKVDFTDLKLETQPKISALVICTQGTGADKKYLIQRRTKMPYFGYHGFITSKVKYGESVITAAERELFEETGITARCKLKNILREFNHDKVNKLVEDKIFFIVHATYVTGELRDTAEGKNLWMTEAELNQINKIFYDIFDLKKLLESPSLTFSESNYQVAGY